MIETNAILKRLTLIKVERWQLTKITWEIPQVKPICTR